MRRTLGTLALAGLALTFATAVHAESEGGDEQSGGARAQPGGARRGNAAAGGALFASACAVCHGTDGGGGSGGPNVRGASARTVLNAVREGEDAMPRFAGIGPKAARNIAAFLSGAAQTPAPPPSPSPGSSPPTWKGQISAFFAQNCAACHKAAAAAMGVRLDSYTTVSLNAARALAAIQAGRMPPGGSVAGSQVQALSDWIQAGKPQ